MPPIPPMPPPPGIAGAASFLGASAIIASVVMRRPATDAASWSAARTTFAGSTIPAWSISILLGLGVKAEGLRLVVPDPADDDRALDARILGDLTDRSLERLQHDVDAGLNVRILARQLLDG